MRKAPQFAFHTLPRKKNPPKSYSDVSKRLECHQEPLPPAFVRARLRLSRASRALKFVSEEARTSNLLTKGSPSPLPSLSGGRKAPRGLTFPH